MNDGRRMFGGEIGSRFSGLDKIGEGTYGVVFRGIHKRSGRKVALKKIALDIDGEGVPSTCIREISVLKDLRHTNIVRLHDVIHSGDNLFLVFEYVDQDLRGFLDQLPGKRLPPPYVKSFIYQLLQAMTYCHTRRVLHRDLKPQNLLVDSKGTIKLADFGLARNFTWPSRAYTHEVVTLWYRAPEVLLGGRYYSTGLDIWSLGCIFVEMAVGRSPFPGDSEIDQLYKIFKVLGTPTVECWPSVEQLPHFKNLFPKWVADEDRLLCVMGNMDEDAIDLVKEMLVYDPEERTTAKTALCHRFLRDVPLQPPDVSKLLTRETASQEDK